MLETVNGFLQDWGYLALFVIVLLESSGLPLPGESLLIAAGIMAGRGSLEIWGVVAAAWAGGTLGDNIGYGLGHRYGRGLAERYGRNVGLTTERLRIVEEDFRRHGPPIVLITRFVLVLRQVAGFAAGTLRLPWWQFLFFNAAGAALWAGAYSGGAFLFGHGIERYLKNSPWAYAAIAAVFVGLAAGTILRFRRRILRKEMENGISKLGSAG